MVVQEAPRSSPPQDLVLTSPEPKQPTFVEMIDYAVRNGGAIEVIERLWALQKDEREYQSKVSFDEALSRCQQEIKRVAPDADNPSTHSKYATYTKLDRILKPIYTKEGFSISYSEEDCPTPGKTRFVAFVSRSGYTRMYRKDMTPSTKGPQGKDVMTPLHADAAADSYAKRYLLKNVFNIAIGAEDSDGVEPGTADTNWLQEQIDEINRCETLDGLQNAFTTAANCALNEIRDINAYDALKKAKEARKKALGGR